MKQLLILLTLLIALPNANAQKIRGLDSSPLDLAIFRPDGQNATPVTRIIYSRPQKKGREIFGGIVPFNKIWRTGANQTTEINLYRDITFEGKKLKAGNYTLYTIPGEKEWTIIFNSKLHTWGAFDYDQSKDVLRFKVPSQTVNTEREAFGIAFSGDNGNGLLLMAWDKTEIVIKFSY